MESVFDVIAEPSRRAILSLLVSSQQSVGEIERQLRMPQASLSKHLRGLREYAKQFGIETPKWPPQAAQKS